MSKQTAVDWFFDKIKSHFEHDGDLLETLTFTYAIAKKMEKDQIITANEDFSSNAVGEFLTGEQYYNQTYKETEK